MDIETELLFLDGGLSKIRFMSKIVSALLSASEHLDETDDIFGENVLLALSKANLTPEEADYLLKLLFFRPGKENKGEVETIEITRPSGYVDTTDAVFASRLVPCPHRPECWAGGIACNRCDYFRGSAKLENGNAVVRCAFLYCKENEK